MFTTTIEQWMVDKNGNEFYGKTKLFFDTKEERDWYRYKYNLGTVHESNMKLIKEAYKEYLETE